MEVYVIRHTKVNVASGICYGQTDVDVAATFETEAEALTGKLPVSFDVVYSSPLKRCMQLARKFGKNIITDDRLKEMHFGDWELKCWNEIPESQIAPWYIDYVHTSAIGGESFSAVYERLHAFMEDLRKNTHNQKVLIVCHGGIIRSIWCYILQIPLENAFKIPVGFGEILQIKLGKTSKEDHITQKK